MTEGGGGLRCLGNPLFLCKGSVKLDRNALQRARRRAILKAEKRLEGMETYEHTRDRRAGRRHWTAAGG